MVKIPTTEELFEAMVYFGHQVSKRHPQMEPYLYAVKNNIHLIDLEKTRECLVKAIDFVKEIASKNGQILFVGTKPAAREIVKKYAEKVNMPYVIERWLGGTLTNFSEIFELIKKLKKMEEEKQAGEWEKYTKKEKLKLEKKLNHLSFLVGGMKNLEKIPEAICLIDLRREKTAVREARKAGVKSIGLVDTDGNPTLVDYPIPGNDESTKSIEMIIKLITEAIEEGKKEIKSSAEVSTDHLLPAVGAGNEKQKATDKVTNRE